MSQTPKPEISNPSEHESTNLTKRQISHRDYYAKNKARIIKYRKSYHLEHREEILLKVRNHYHQNRDKRLAYGKKWREENADKMRLYKQKSDATLKANVFSKYGGAKCVCCGETEGGFLTIDHINGGGNIHRKAIKTVGGKDFYRWLRLNSYPEGYQVLCFNCNLGKSRCGGICPHQATKTPL